MKKAKVYTKWRKQCNKKLIIVILKDIIKSIFTRITFYI